MTNDNPFSVSNGSHHYDSGTDRIIKIMTGVAIASMVLALFSFIFMSIGVAINIGNLGLASESGDTTNVSYHIGKVAGSLFFVLAPLGIMYGQYQATRLGKYKWAKQGALLMMIPCTSPFVILGIPLGIWQFILLSKPQVRERFADLN